MRFSRIMPDGSGIWCLVEFRRNWRKASELWGMDWVDIVYRLKGQFGVSLTDTDFVNRSPEGAWR